jgi:hypothetical protein
VVLARLKRSLGREDSVIEILEGNLRHAGGKHAIFLIFQPHKTPWYVLNALDALSEAGINVLLVVNHDLTAERRSELKESCNRIMIRDNSGFDMGGYKDGTLALHMTEKPSRVIYMNDSVYYFREGLTELLRRLTESDYDVSATFENWEIHHHFQSFCYSISGRLFAHPAIQGFWRSYLPVSSRRWAIHEGEVGVSRFLRSYGESLEVIYTPAQLTSALRELSANDLAHLVTYLPREYRISLRQARSANVEELVDEISVRVASHSPIHVGGFLFRRLLRCPIMKRDLVYRILYDLNEIAVLLKEVGDEEKTPEIMTDFRKKGSGLHFKSWNRAKFAMGLK